MSALLYLIRQARQSAGGCGVAAEEVAARIEFLWGEIERCERTDEVWDELFRLPHLAPEEALDLLDRADP